MLLALVTGALAGIVMGWVLERGQICFCSMFSEVGGGRRRLLPGWLLGVAVAAVGLALLYATPWFAPMNQGLPLRPVRNVLGGLAVGVGMAVARSCVSGLLYRLGEGMLGALAGLAGWAVGELVASSYAVPGPTVLPGGYAATVPSVLHVPRLLVAVALLGVAVLVGRRTATSGPTGWSWVRVGLGLGAATVLGWALARVGGASFGPSTVGAVHGLATGRPMVWLTAFLVGIVLGAHLAARRTGTVRVRGETPVRYLRLAVGGVLLGGGGWVAGGCNLGHAVSGAAQLDVSSYVVVAAMATGVLGARWVERTSD